MQLDQYKPNNVSTDGEGGKERQQTPTPPPKTEPKPGFEESVDEIQEESGEEGEGWLATYADMVTLLLCFFVLLFSISSTEMEKFEQLVQSLRSALGKQNVPEAGTREGLKMIQRQTDEVKPNAVDELGGMVQKEIDKIVSEVKEFVMFNKLGGKVRVEGDEMGARITISDVVLFPPGNARMTPEGLKVMKDLTEILKQFSYHIKVTGHTDNVPIHNEKYASNWELSANRACEVVRFLIDQGIPPEMLSAEGFAEYRPIASNDTPEGRAKNRRVEIMYERRYIAEKMGLVPEYKLRSLSSQ